MGKNRKHKSTTIKESQPGALRWMGGKSARTPSGIGRWTAKQLPVKDIEVYCEPFAGMLGVLLQRSPVRTEIINDLDDEVVNWWRVVREHPQKLSNALKFTPYSETEFKRCVSILEEVTADEVEMARAFTVVVTQGMARKNFVFTDSGTNWLSGLDNRIAVMAKRIKDVVIFNKDACKVIKSIKAIHGGKALIYCDPPYYSTDRHYEHNRINIDELTKALLESDALIAISGVGTEWDHLGWHRKGNPVKMKHTIRDEAIWMNYEPEMQVSLL